MPSSCQTGSVVVQGQTSGDLPEGCTLRRALSVRCSPFCRQVRPVVAVYSRCHCTLLLSWRPKESCTHSILHERGFCLGWGAHLHTAEFSPSLLAKVVVSPTVCGVESSPPQAVSQCHIFAGRLSEATQIQKRLRPSQGRSCLSKKMFIRHKCSKKTL